jgi:5-methyltetrahydropteroyltriglutamate--homocysteine methyltransferase
VGSLLRPPELRAARAARAEGRLGPAALRAVEDRCIRDAVARQKAVGLRAVTDGEYRRAFWHFDFLARLGGVEMVEAEQGIQFKGGQTKAYGLKVTAPIRYRPHPFVDDFRFVAAEAGAAGAVPEADHPLALRAALPRRAEGGRHPHLPGDGGLLRRPLRRLRRGVTDFAAAGCRYLQLDEVNIAYLCDPEQIEQLRARSEKVEGLLETYAGLINGAIAGRPADMVVSMHLCRGNFRSMHIASGGYDPVAEVLFNGIDVDAYFMEYDTSARAAFAPLRFVPKGKTVVSGLVTSKTGELERRTS